MITSGSADALDDADGPSSQPGAACRNEIVGTPCPRRLLDRRDVAARIPMSAPRRVSSCQQSQNGVMFISM
jgi:hypothetical protein